MSDELLPDTETAIIEWLRSADILRRLGGRVYDAIPSTSPLPVVRVARIGGGDDPGDAPVDDAIVQITVHAATRPEAVDVANRIRTVFRRAHSGHDVTWTHESQEQTVRVHGVVIDSVQFSPDPVNDRPRIFVTARVTATAA